MTAGGQTTSAGYAYRSFEPGLWTVGFYDPAGEWQPESDHESPAAAADRVAWLNGSRPAPAEAPPAEDLDERVVAALTEVARSTAGGRQHDFAGWLAYVLARVAAELGSADALLAGRPGSWEAAAVEGLVKGTVGWDDDYLQLPEWRTRAPEFGHTAYGLEVGEDNYRLFAAGHVDPRRFIAAANHFIRHNQEGARFADLLGDRPPAVQHTHAAHDWNSTAQAWRLTLYAFEGRPGSFPVTVLEY